MRTVQRVGTGLLALTLAAGVAACGDDSDSSGSTTTAVEASGASAAFCDAIVEFNSAVFQVDLDENSTEDQIKEQGAQLAPVFQTVADEAPDDLAADAATLNTTVQALTEGNAEAFNSDATFEQYTALVDDAVDACEMDTVDVTAVDYAYEGAPDDLDAGTVAFSFTNEAETEDHMMAIIKKKDGVELSWDDLLALPEDQAGEKTEFKGEAFASAGDSSTTLTDLDAGEYAMICFISVGSPEAEDGPPHFTKGMVHEFTVE